MLWSSITGTCEKQCQGSTRLPISKCLVRLSCSMSITFNPHDVICLRPLEQQQLESREPFRFGSPATATTRCQICCEISALVLSLEARTTRPARNLLSPDRKASWPIASTLGEIFDSLWRRSLDLSTNWTKRSLTPSCGRAGRSFACETSVF